jgi:hypothetical protein
MLCTTWFAAVERWLQAYACLRTSSKYAIKDLVVAVAAFSAESN